jgi:hypothetical protein
VALPNPSTVRLPPALRAEVEGIAEREHRTFSAQVVALLEDALRLPTRERAIIRDLVVELGAREVDG